MRYYLIFDLGTTNLKAIAYDGEERVLKEFSKKIRIKSPNPGWVEQDPEEYSESLLNLGKEVIDEFGKPEGIGITNQRATTIVWDKRTGDPLYDMITWQDTRSYEIAEYFSTKFIIKFGKALGKISETLSNVFSSLKSSERIKYLVTIAYLNFSANQPAMHLKWLLENVEGIKQKAKEGNLCFGTLDSFAIKSLSGAHLTDVTNASATGMFDPFFLKWSDRILSLLEIPKECLPKVVENSYNFGTCKEFEGAELKAVIADQQASLLYAGIEKGTMKMTNGTGSFIDLNVGSSPMPGRFWTYPMVAYKIGREVRYLLEGIVQCSGSAIEWMVEVGLAKSPEEVCEMAASSESRGIIFLPTFSGIGTPYWKDLRGAVFGLSRGDKRENLARALIEGIAFRCAEVILTVERAYDEKIKKILADGKASKCDFLLQFIADLTGKEILRPKDLEGALRGTLMLTKGYGKEIKEIWRKPEIEKGFIRKDERKLNNWKNALKKYMEFYEEVVFTKSSHPR